MVLVDQRSQGQLRDLVEAAARWQQRNPAIRDELREWTGARGSDTRDGVPPSAYPCPASGQPDAPAGWDGVLTRRDFDQGHGEGQLETGGPPSVTAILVTAGDTPTDWLRAGQALNRMLVHAASVWVFAALNSQPMESPPLRTLVRSRLLPARRAADAAPVRPGAHRRGHRAPTRRRADLLTRAQDPGQLGGGPGRPGARRGQPGGRGVQHLRGPGLQLDLHLPPGVLLPPAVRVGRVRP